MTTVSLLRLETGRLFRAWVPRLLMLFTVLSPLFGLWLYRPLASTSPTSYTVSLNSAYIGNPAMAGSLLGAISFAVLTVMELNKARRSHVDILSDSVITPVRMALVRTVSMLLAAVVTQAATLLVWLPVSAVQVGSIFRPLLFLQTYLVIMLPALFLAVLFAAAAYQITRRLDLTLVLIAVFTVLDQTLWQDSWLLRWASPALYSLSDDFGNQRRLMSVGWNRLFWLLLITALWLLSFICMRRYGKGLFGSIKRNIRKVYIPALALLLAASSGFAYAAQPFLDNSPGAMEGMSVSYVTAGSNEGIHLQSIELDARPNMALGSQHGTVTYRMQNSAKKEHTLVFWINPGYSFSSVTANGAPAAFRETGTIEYNRKTIEVDVPADEDLELAIEFGGFPQEWSIMRNTQGEAEISRDYMYLLGQNLMPMLRDVNWQDDSGILGVEMTLPADLRPVVFGESNEEVLEEYPDGTKRWRMTAEHISTMVICVGDYISQSIQAAGIDIEFYYSKKHQRVMEENDVAAVIRQVFDYCTERYGPLPAAYGAKGLELIEQAAGGGFAGEGASIMGEESFNEQGLKDPLKGAGGSQVLAHEIVHQWWGLAKAFSIEPDAGEWSSEGLTVYTTYRMMKEQYGADYVQKNYIDVWQAKMDAYYKNFYVRNPAYMEKLPEQYKMSIQGSLDDTRRYCEMPLKILKAEELVGGEEKMDEILQKLYRRVDQSSQPYLTYQNFLDACGLEKEDLNLE